MSRLLILVDKPEDWTAFYPTEDLISAQDYLAQGSQQEDNTPTQVINLCRNYRYLSYGYYCSLLAEARGHKVIPSIQTINDLGKKSIYGLNMESLNKALNKTLSKNPELAQQVTCEQELSIQICFGRTRFEPLADLARQIFERFPCPILSITFRQGEHWLIQAVKPEGLSQLKTSEEDTFAHALDTFSRKVWRKPSLKRKYRYDMAILVDPEEKLPPSNTSALRHMIRAGRRLGIDVELIQKRDYTQLAEYDALFIRETTSISNHTYKFAKKAEMEGMIVLDDPNSILKCTNKVYLADLLAKKGVPIPETHFLYKDRKDTLDFLVKRNQFPLVLKIPDGAFSKGVVKVSNAEELVTQAKAFLKQSAIVIAQEFMYTDYDWRIGILNNKPLFACQYFMSKGHWQIYNHAGGKSISGAFRTLPVHEVPTKVLKVALKATKLIGNGLYGVDIKQSGDRIVVIEVNDNPNLDAGVEDAFLKDDLYRLLMEDFLRRLECQRLGLSL